MSKRRTRREKIASQNRPLPAVPAGPEETYFKKELVKTGVVSLLLLGMLLTWQWLERGG